MSPDPLRLLEPLLAPVIVAVSMPICSDAIETLAPEERNAIVRAAASRQAEFASGRQCAREAILRLTGAPATIPMAADRSPVWPPNIIGTITHDGGWCIAAVAPGSVLRSIGIDLATVENFRAELQPQICTPAEIIDLQGHPQAVRRQRLAAIFSIKESFYKAQHPVTGAWLGFEDVQVALYPAPALAGRCRVTLLRPAGSFHAGDFFEGRWATDGLRCVSVSTLG